MAEARPITVTLGRRRPTTSDDMVGRPPITLVHIASDPSWKASEAAGKWPEYNGTLYQAMIDTGAEAAAIDRRVAEALNAQAASKGVVHGMDGTFEAYAVPLQIIFPEANIVFSSRAAVLNFEQAGHTFDLILGRSFLQHCQFSLDGPTGRYMLDWIG